ncbi:MAG: methyltransferase domain-containing protein, partial [Demequina sp.]
MSPTADATETYYETMASSLGDKERILPHLVPGTIADVGSGGGVLANSLVSRGYHVVGIDPNPRPVDGVEVHPIYADQIGTVTPAEKFDNIIACAVLHEVFSYGNRHQQPGRLQNLEGTLREFRRSLKTGGRLIVRDGVKPAEPHASMTLHQWDDADVQRFVDASPFTSPGTDVGITLERTAPGYWEGSGSSVMECAFTLTWGP